VDSVTSLRTEKILAIKLIANFNLFNQGLQHALGQFDNPSTIFVFRFAQHHLAFVISRKGPSNPKNIAGPVDVIRLQGEAIVTDAIQALDGSGLPPGYGD
jgi:hypothetical protein